MATLREMQMALGNKIEELKQTKCLVEELEKEVESKEACISQLCSELDNCRSVLRLFQTQSSHAEMSDDELIAGFSRAHYARTFGGSHRTCLLQRAKRLAISAESTESETTAASTSDADRQKRAVHIQKTEASKDIINRAIQENELMKKFDSAQIREIIECMHPVEYRKDSVIIKEGDEGSLVYAVEEGTVEISKSGNPITKMGPGEIFGEIAILYNCKRTASAKAATTCKLWAIDRRVFKTIMMSTGIKKLNEYTNFLLSVPEFKTKSPETISKIAEALEEVRYDYGEYIIRQNQPGDTFYIISKGYVNVTQEQPGSNEVKFIRTLKPGEYFGERALETEEKRSANIIAWDKDGVTCLVLERDAYKQLISKSGIIRQNSYDNNNKENVQSTIIKKPSDEFSDLKLTDLIYVATLGVGGFGRVELVTIKDNKRAFALKKMAKHHVVDTSQQEHVMNEKTILLESRSNFIIRLYKTFKDSKYVYMLLEPGLGGELWTLLRDRKSFDSNATRFYTACVIEGLVYLHSRGILYRDLKPENLILDESGYAKMVDFGFAKNIGSNKKTWTFCGTPEYVAPEIILNKGHDFAVDLWSLGVLIFELHVGRAPFTGTDHMKTYNVILKGIDAIEFPRTFNKLAQKLVKQLCRDAPNDRLDLKAAQRHKWYDGFNWDGLRKKTLKAPHVIKLRNQIDHSNFDSIPKENSSVLPPDDNSGWDRDF